MFRDNSWADSAWKDVRYRGLVQKYPVHHPELVRCLHRCPFYWETGISGLQEPHSDPGAGLKQVSCESDSALFTSFCLGSSLRLWVLCCVCWVS